MLTVSIHQPQYFPWIPYFDKTLQSDRFIFLDTVQFQKNGVQNRNQIKTPAGALWLTVPIRHDFGQVIRDVPVADPKIFGKHLKTIEQNYKKAPSFYEVMEILKPTLESRPEKISDLNIRLTLAILRYLDYRGETVLASDLRVEGKASDLVLNLCLAVNANRYVSGQGGKDYMALEDFKAKGIDVVFQEYRSVEYPQLHSEAGFVGNLSVIDLLFNKGRGSTQVISQGRIQ